MSHKNSKEHKKEKKVDPLRFFDNPKYFPKKNLAKTPRTLPPPHWISNYCASMVGKMSKLIKRSMRNMRSKVNNLSEVSKMSIIN